MKQRSITLLILLTIMMPSVLHGQYISQLGEPVDPENPQNIFRIQPQLQPSPALKYRLLPKFIDERQGNAAVYYGKVQAEQIAFFSNQELQMNIINLIDAPLEDVKDSPHGPTACPDNIYAQLRNAALCDHCDWQIPIRHERFFEILLPELQQTRHFCRLLAARARYQIASGRYEDAIETLQTGYAVAKHDATGPTYIHMLVAIACKTLMDEQLECLIQQPDAPNMYWAIASLPDPLLSIRNGAEAEMSFIELSFPHLRDMSEEKIKQHTPEFWHQQLVELMGLTTLVSTGQFDWNEIEAEAETQVAAITLRGYPRARRFLVGEGMDADFVKGLSPSQAVLIAGIKEFHQQNQELIKWSYLPYFQAAKGIDDAEDKLARWEVDGDTVLALASVVSPAVQQIMAAQARSERQTAVLQTVEAVRLYAADNDGRLPADPSDLEDYPMPLDPVTGKPIAMMLENGQLSISGPPLPSGGLGIKIEIVD